MKLITLAVASAFFAQAAFAQAPEQDVPKSMQVKLSLVGDDGPVFNISANARVGHEQPMSSQNVITIRSSCSDTPGEPTIIKSDKLYTGYMVNILHLESTPTKRKVQIQYQYSKLLSMTQSTSPNCILDLPETVNFGGTMAVILKPGEPVKVSPIEVEGHTYELTITAD